MRKFQVLLNSIVYLLLIEIKYLDMVDKSNLHNRIQSGNPREYVTQYLHLI